MKYREIYLAREETIRGQEIKFKGENMTSTGQIVSTIFAVGFAAGLAVSSYHMSQNIDYKNEYYANVVNKPNTQIAMKYYGAYENIVRLEESFKDNASWNGDISVLSDVYTKTNDVIVSLASIANNENLLDASVDIYKDILVFQKLETNADKYIEIQNEILTLEENAKNLAEKYEPTIDSIKEQQRHIRNRYLGCGFGIGVSSAALIGFGIWAGIEWNEEISYIKRTRGDNKRTRTKI
jgi:hypothetical protein